MLRHSFGQDRFAREVPDGYERRARAASGAKLLNDVKITREYGAGEVIYSQGAECQGIFCIESGLVGHRKYDAEGYSALIRLCGPAEFIGYRAYLCGSRHRLTAEALLPTRVSLISRRRVQRLLAENPSLHVQFLRKAVADLTDTEERYFHSVTRSAKVRAIHMLLDLYERFGSDTPSGEHVLELPLSRQNLAALIGIAPESMSRTIKRLEAEQLVQFDGRRVHLRDLDRLFGEVELLS